MNLFKKRYVTLINFAKAFDKTKGIQTYTQTSTQQILVSPMPFKASLVPDFQIDLARFKDHWMLVGNDIILTDQSVVVQIAELYYLPVYSQDNSYLDPRTGSIITIVKLNVDKKYGLNNG